MSVIDEALAAVTPQASDEQRAEARATARAAATPGDWLSQILDHHIDLENAFAAVQQGGDEGGRTSALKRLGILLMGHATAEESVIYPGMAEGGEKGHATHAYSEQATVKMEMAKLEQLDPSGDAFAEKVESIRSAVSHHMYEEEGTWFPDLLRDLPADAQQMMTSRYAEEYRRYVGAGAGDRPAMRMEEPSR